MKTEAATEKIKAEASATVTKDCLNRATDPGNRSDKELTRFGKDIFNSCEEWNTHKGEVRRNRQQKEAEEKEKAKALEKLDLAEMERRLHNL